MDVIKDLLDRSLVELKDSVMVVEGDNEFDDFMLDTLSDAHDIKNELCVKIAKQHESKIAECDHPWSHFVIGRMLFEGIHPFNKNAHKAFLHMTIAAEKKVYEAYWYLSQMYGYRQQEVLNESTVKLASSCKTMMKIQLRMWAKSAIAGPYFYSSYSLKQFSDTTKTSALAANAYCEVISKLCTKINVYKLCHSTPNDQLGQHYFELACLLLYTDVEDEGFAKRVAIRLKMSKIARELHDGNIDRDWTDCYDDIKKILPAVTIECLIKAGEHGCPAGFYYLRYLYCQDTQLILSPEGNHHVVQFPCQLEENRAVAFTYLKRAASGGHPMAQYEIIIRGDSKYPYRYLFAGISLNVLSTYLESLLHYGYKQILLLLATCYFRGAGVTRDKKKALDCLEEMLLAPAIVYFPIINDQVSCQQLSEELLEHNIYGIAGYQSPVPTRYLNDCFDSHDYIMPYHYFLLAFFYERGLGATTNDNEKAASFYRLSYELVEKFLYNYNHDHFTYFYGISRGYSLLSLCRIGKMIEGDKIDCDNLTVAEECYKRALITYITGDKKLQLAYAYYRLGKFYSNVDYENHRSLAKSYYHFDEVLCIDANQPDLFRNYCSYYMGKIYDYGLGGGEVNHKLAAMNYSELAGVINAHFHPYCDIYFTYIQQKAKTRIKSEVPLEILRKGKNVIATYEKACKFGTDVLDIVRIIIFGVGNVGKTSLMKSLIGEEVIVDEPPTINVDTSRLIDSSDWDADGKIQNTFQQDASDTSGVSTDSDADEEFHRKHEKPEQDKVQNGSNVTSNIANKNKNMNNNGSNGEKYHQNAPNEIKHSFIDGDINGGKGLLKSVLKKGIAEKIRASLQQLGDQQNGNGKQNGQPRSRSRSVSSNKSNKTRKRRTISAHELQSGPRERKYSLQGNVRGNNERPKTPPLVKEDNGLQFKFWDFSPNFECYATQMLSRSSVYILVFNAAKHVQEMIENRDGSHDIYTYLDKMMSWLQSIHLHTSREEDCVLRNDLSFTPPAVILVGTHGDEIQAENDDEKTTRINEMFVEIMKTLEDEPYHKHIIYSNIVVNTRNRDDENINKLRQLIKDVARSLPACKDKIPKKWLNNLTYLRGLRQKNQAQTFTVQELMTHDNNIDDDTVKMNNNQKDLEIILDYFHDIGEVLRFPRDHSLNATMLGDIEWLIQSITKLLNWNALSFATHARRLTEEWEKFKITGIVSDRYIEKIWPNYNLNKGKDIILAVMQYLDLLCQQNSQAESKESTKESSAKARNMEHKAKYYYVPCTMSNCSLPSDEELYPQDCIRSVCLKLAFKDEIPDLTFYRLLTCCLRKWNTNAKLYRNCITYSIATQVFLIIKKEGTKVGLQILFRPVNKNESKKEIDDKMITNGIGIAARVFVEKQLIKLLKKWNGSMKKQYIAYFPCPCVHQVNHENNDQDDEMKQMMCNHLINLSNVINTLEASKDQKIQYKNIDCDHCRQTFGCMNYLKFWYKLPDENLQS